MNQRKKIKLFGFLFSMAVFCGLPMPVFAEEATAGTSDSLERYTYTIIDGEATITSFVWENEETLVIPDTIEGCPVTVLGDQAFLECYADHIVFPDTLRVIGDECFSGAYYLTELTLPVGLESIGYYAFYECESINQVTIPDTVTEIGYAAFSYTNWELLYEDALMLLGDGILYRYRGEETELILPDTVKVIGEYAFDGVSMLESLTIPDSVQKIGSGAFEYCGKLKHITFPDCIPELAYDAFVLTPWFSESTEDFLLAGSILYAYRGTATDVVVPDTVKVIGESAFERNQTLRQVTLPASVTAVRDAAFYSCPALQRVNFLGIVSEIGEMAFYNCMALDGIVLPEGLISVGARAFVSCTALQTVQLPESVTEIGEMAVGFVYQSSENGFTEQTEFTLRSDSAAVQLYAENFGLTCEPAEAQEALSSLAPVAVETTAAETTAQAASGIGKWVYAGILAILAIGVAVLTLRHQKKKQEKT